MGCEDKIIQFRCKVQGIQKILEAIAKNPNSAFSPSQKKRLKKLKNLIGELKESGIKECIKLGETLSNWEEEINNIQKYNINSGFVEGKNNKIKVIKRLSYGIKKFDNLKKLIHYRTFSTPLLTKSCNKEIKKVSFTKKLT